MTAPGHPVGTVIAVAPTGAHAKDDVPHLPVTAEEVSSAAADCERIGAAVVDLQLRADTVLSEVVTAVRERTHLAIRVTAPARQEALEQVVDAGADVVACPLDAAPDFVTDLRERARARGMAVHYEARSLSHLAALGELQPAEPVHVILVFDIRGMRGDVQTFASALAQLPRGATFTATGVETESVPVMLASFFAGGHVRVGMSDTLKYAEDVAVRDNAQLVARAAGVAKIAQRPPLAPARAAEILGLGE